MDRYQPAMTTIPEMPESHSILHKEPAADTKHPADDDIEPCENETPELEPESNHQTDATPTPPALETNTSVEIKVQSLTAKFFLNLPDESIIPVHYLERAEDTGMSPSITSLRRRC